MSMRVILDGVSTAYDLTCELGTSADAFTDAEERRANATFLEQGKNAWCDLRIGTIIDRDGHLSLFRGGVWQTRPVGTQQTAARHEARGREQRMVGDERAERPGPG